MRQARALIPPRKLATPHAALKKLKYKVILYVFFLPKRPNYSRIILFIYGIKLYCDNMSLMSINWRKKRCNCANLIYQFGRCLAVYTLKILGQFLFKAILKQLLLYIFLHMFSLIDFHCFIGIFIASLNNIKYTKIVKCFISNFRPFYLQKATTLRIGMKYNYR